LKLDNILNHYLPRGAQAVEQIINLKNQEEAITTVERQLAAAAPPEAYEKLADAVKYAQAELAQAKATYETGRRHCEEIAAAIEKIKELSQYSEQNIDRKNDEHIIAASAKVQATLNLFREKLLHKLNQLESVVEYFLYLLHKSDLVHRVEIDIIPLAFPL